MSELLKTFSRHDRLRDMLDWAMFSLGAVSLTIAVGATVLTRTSLLG